MTDWLDENCGSEVGRDPGETRDVGILATAGVAG
jgi:hypothetical protein